MNKIKVNCNYIILFISLEMVIVFFKNFWSLINKISLIFYISFLLLLGILLKILKLFYTLINKIKINKYESYYSLGLIWDYAPYAAAFAKGEVFLNDNKWRYGIILRHTIAKISSKSFIFEYIPVYLNFITFLLILLIFIVSTAFLTLEERIFLGTIQSRKGPSKIAYGLLQPIVDAFKLIFKEFVIPDKSSKTIFVYIALFGFICVSCIMALIPFSFNFIICNASFSFFFIYMFNLFHVYSILLSGWSSKSRYSFLGSIRSSSQLISYDIALAFIILIIFCFSKTLNFIEIIEYQASSKIMAFVIPIQLILFLIVGSAETSRHPFDLPEAEPELVSGYNVEYSAIRFALFFLAEYLAVILFSIMVILNFFGGWTFYFFVKEFEYILKISVVMLIILTFRAILPRYRIDQLMRVNWKYIIPFQTVTLLFTIFVVYLTL